MLVRVYYCLRQSFPIFYLAFESLVFVGHLAMRSVIAKVLLVPMLEEIGKGERTAHLKFFSPFFIPEYDCVV